MRDCVDVMMQEALPAFGAGRLEAEEAEAVRRHLASCEVCARERALLSVARAVIDQATPALDPARISAAVTVARSGVVRTAVATSRGVEGRPRRWWTSRQWLAAAASVLLVASLSIPALRGAGDGPAVDGTGNQGGGDGSPAIDLAGGLADLSSTQLETLLRELDRVEATVRAEPVTIALPILDTPESL